MAKIGQVQEFAQAHPNQWLVLEVIESNENGEVTVGRLLSSHGKRAEAFAALPKGLGRSAVLFAGEFPPKGVTLAI